MINVLYVGNLNKGYKGLKELLSLETPKGIRVKAVISRQPKPDEEWNESVSSMAEVMRSKYHYFPKDVNNEQFCEVLKDTQDFDIGLSNGSGGQLYKPRFFEIPKWGFLNIHFSLLPEYRGAYPVPHAVMNDEKWHGVTLHRISKGMDTGAILRQEEVPIFEADTGRDVYLRCEHMAVKLIRGFFGQVNLDIEEELLRAREQKHISTDTTYRKADLDTSGLQAPLSQGSRKLYNFVRAWDFPEYKNPAWIVVNGEKIFLTTVPLEYGMEHGECRYLTYKDYKIFMIPEKVFNERN